jgi:hypothetical protein
MRRLAGRAGTRRSRLDAGWTDAVGSKQQPGRGATGLLPSTASSSAVAQCGAHARDLDGSQAAVLPRSFCI